MKTLFDLALLPKDVVYDDFVAWVKTKEVSFFDSKKEGRQPLKTIDEPWIIKLYKNDRDKKRE